MTSSVDINSYTSVKNLVSHKLSSREAIVDVGNKTLKKFTVPQDSKLTIHLVLVAYLNSIECKKLGKAHRKNIVLSLELLCRFIEHDEYITDSEIPTTLFERFTVYLSEHTKKNTNALKDSINKAKTPFEWAIKNQDIEQLVNLDISNFRTLIAHIPKVVKSKSKKKPALSVLFDGCPYTDTELIKSLRLLSCWTLLEYERHRSLLLEYKEVTECIAALNNYDLSEPPMDFGAWSGKKGKKALEDKCREIYGLLIKRVIELDDSVLLERLVSSMNLHFDLPLTDEQLEIMVPKLLTKSGLSSKQITFKGKINNTHSIISLTVRDLIAPSHVEVFSAQCFFASDRIQSSNLDKLTIEDISINETSIQAQHTKNRRIRNKRNTGPIYPKNGLISDSIQSYLNVLNSCQDSLPLHDKNKALPYITSEHLKVGDIGRSKNALTIFYKLLITEGTHTRRELFSDISEHDAKPILWIIEKIFDNNLMLKEEEAKYSAELKSSKKRFPNKKVERSSIIKTERISLNATYIGESRVAMKGGNNVWVKGEQKEPSFNDSFADAELTAHTETTKNNIYKDRSQATEVIKERSSFVEKVAQLMEEDALKMGQLMAKTKVVNLDEAKNMLGCSTDINSFKSLMTFSGEYIGLSGEFHHDDSTIFVENELTAALIIKRIAHIESQLTFLLVDDPELQNKAMNAVMDLVYHKEVLNKFSQSIKHEGESLAKQLTLTYSEML